MHIAEQRTPIERLLHRLNLHPSLATYALGVFLVSRVAYVIITVVATRFLNTIPHGLPVPSFLAAWSRWDATHYAYIALNGYTRAGILQSAFFPLMPLLMHLVASVTGGNVYLAGILIANACYLIALFGLGVLVSDYYDHATARRSMLYLTIFPTGFFLFAAYTESLFLALAIWFVIACRRGAWWQAGTLGLLASLTRQMGVFLMLPFAWYYLQSIEWQWNRVRTSAVAMGLIPAGVGLFMLWLWHAVGDPLAFAHVEPSWTHTLLPPWETLWRALVELAHTVDPVGQRKDLVDLGAVLLIPVLIARGARRFPPGELAYAAAVWLLAVSYPTTNWLLQSDARYMMAAFPCFIVLAWEGRRRWLNVLVLVVFGAAQFLLLQYFVRGAVIL